MGKQKTTKLMVASASDDVVAAKNGNAVYDAMVAVLMEAVELAVFSTFRTVCHELTGNDDIADHLDDVEAFIKATIFMGVKKEFDELILCYGSEAKDHLPYITASAMFHCWGISSWFEELVEDQQSLIIKAITNMAMEVAHSNNPSK